MEFTLPAEKTEAQSRLSTNRDKVFSNSPEYPPTLQDFKNYLDAELEELEEAGGKPPLRMLKNREGLTLEAIHTQFERARDVVNHNRNNTASVAWVLQYGAEQTLEENKFLAKTFNPDWSKEDGKLAINVGMKRSADVIKKEAKIEFQTPQLI